MNKPTGPGLYRLEHRDPGYPRVVRVEQPFGERLQPVQFYVYELGVAVTEYGQVHHKISDYPSGVVWVRIEEGGGSDGATD